MNVVMETGVDKNTTVAFPAPLMSTIGELGSFLARETAAARPMAPHNSSGATSTPVPTSAPMPVAATNGAST